VAVLPIVPLMQIAKLGFRPCVRRDVCLASTASCGTWLRVNCAQVLRRPSEPAGFTGEVKLRQNHMYGDATKQALDRNCDKTLSRWRRG
jgi:hypothetical protein